MKKTMHRLMHATYTLLVLFILGIALLFLGTRTGMFDYQIKIVQSGSMEPAIATGGAVLIAPSESYRIGDVITFGRDTRNSVPTTHRIVGVEEHNGRLAFITKGDANEEADAAPVRTSEVIGKVLVDVPYVGYILEFARTPWGYALLVGIPALIIVLDECANIMWEFHKYRARRRTRVQKTHVIGTGLHPTNTERVSSFLSEKRSVAHHDVVPRKIDARSQSERELDIRVLKPYRRA